MTIPNELLQCDATQRLLVIQSGKSRFSIPVNAFGNEWVAAEVFREEFLQKEDSKEFVETAVELENTTEATVDLFSRFLAFVAERLRPNDRCASSRTAVLSAAFRSFTELYLSNMDVHSLATGFNSDLRKTILSSYYVALTTLEAQGLDDIPHGPPSALLTAAEKGEASLYALFGGQGTNEVYFDELQALYDVYTPFVKTFLATLTINILQPLAVSAPLPYYTYGLDVLSWLSGTLPRPPVAYLASVPISLPLIGLTQLTQYLVACRVTHLDPGKIRNFLHGATGHSQGVISAVCIAASSTFESFEVNASKALRWLFFNGMRGQEAFPTLALEPGIVHDAIEGGEGTPSPMLSVSGLSLKELQSHIDTTNKFLLDNSQLQVSLYNGPKTFVVTGPPKSLYGLVVSLRKIRAPSGLDQSKTPFSQRKPVFSARFLVVAVPYHSTYLKEATERVLSDLQGEELWSPVDLAIPVYHTEDGSDLCGLGTSLTRSLCDQINVQPIHWTVATKFPDSATHAIDFGPGGLSGIGPLTARNLEGRGIRIVIVGDKGKGGAELYDSQVIKREQWWAKQYAPALVKTSDGRLHIDTPFSRLLGKPPIMVAGMTPSTVKGGFVSAILRAGYHVELAGGGHYSAEALRKKVAEIQEQIPPGVGLTLNSLYINPRQFGFQYPLWLNMRREGVPLEGFCVAAGIPSAEKAAEIIEGLRAAGIKHVAFKPGSVDGIRQVVSIAVANPDFPIIMQWTGGRAGGHHSYEDFHQPILATYASIRQHSNIVLVAGSGFGGVDDTWPYLTGDWSVNLYGVQKMPFDGFLFASRVMVAKEAHTSPSVKDLIMVATGVDDKEWEGTYSEETGGILTVRSELGEPIHKIATRGVKLWKEFDNSVFKLPKEKRAEWLAQHRAEVIEKLDRDFAKPWFCCKKDGRVVDDLGDMTYEETVLRMVRLMFVAHENRWIDISLRNLTGDWIRRIEERFSGKPKASLLQSFSSLDDPAGVVESFFSTYTEATSQLLAAEDKAYFLAISQRSGQKPVPFIPILDANFEVWFKKDSLWAAEDIEAVFDQDPQRVCILQGPVAVKHYKVKDEPIADLLGGIVSGLAGKILDCFYDNDMSKVPTIGYLAKLSEQPALMPSGVKVERSDEIISLVLGSTVPRTDDWLEVLAGGSLSWLRALLFSSTIVQGSSYIDNPLRRVFAPRAGQKVIIHLNSGEPASIALYGSTRSFGAHKSDFKAAEVEYDSTRGTICVTLYEYRQGSSIPLELIFAYRPDMAYAPIHEVMDDRNRRIKCFYWKLWFGDDSDFMDVNVRETFKCPEVIIESAHVEEFCSIVGNDLEAYKSARTVLVRAPMDFAIVTGWQAIIKAIFPSVINGDLLRLVHLSNGFRMISDQSPLKVGDKCHAEAHIAAVTNIDSGKLVKVKGHVIRNGKPVIEVISSFLYRGTFSDFSNTFEIIDEPDYVVEVHNDVLVGVLRSKDWFEWLHESTPLKPKMTLVFQLRSEVSYKDKTHYASVSVHGDVFVRDTLKNLLKVGIVDFSEDNCQGNPVIAYLQRHGFAEGSISPLSNEGYSLVSGNISTAFSSPLTNEPYSNVSGDFNPIHVNPYFSDYASLPGTIVHGLWSSAATRHFVENIVGNGRPDRILSYEVSFVGMVLPGDELNVNLRHVGMKNGNMVVKVTTSNSAGVKVIEGTAEVAQPTTAYVFTGQGSQEPGMGMDLYSSSPAARAVWESADAHLLSVYGFSIVDIVKNNSKEKTIHFGGIKGQEIRQRYMEMTYDSMDKDGRIKTLPLFADINIRTPQYTFSHPSGLLFATQFAQIALVVTEKAAFEDMRSKGLVQSDCAFAGHSLGEYSALASIGDVLPISALVDVVFYRGITMQRAVERDEYNRSNYAMCAVNPSRVSKTFNDAALREVVDSIAHRTQLLLEIVNYNVEGQQYVCAGELVALQTLTNVLNYLKVENVDIEKLAGRFTVDQVKEMLGEIIKSCFQKAQEQKAKEGYIKLERGFATIPLPGIDVPFHSRYLWAGVMPFRAYLSKKINIELINPDMLVGKYVPNLVAKPFQVTRKYVQMIYDQTSSPSLDNVLTNWERDNWGSAQQRQHLAYIILVELLAYQFASPVRWIETQDVLFAQFDIERFIEIGPSPTLAGMATRTLKAKYEIQDDSVSRKRVILCHSKHTKEIYYQLEDEVVEAVEPATEAQHTPTPAAPAPAPVASRISAPSAPSGPAASIADEPLKAVDTLRTIVAQKLKKSIDEVPLSKSIKELVGGKSTLQNEILGDLQQEFTSAPDRGEELPLEELGSAMQPGYSGALGKYTSGLISRLISSKMPGGFNLSTIKAHLSKSWGLGPARADSVMLLSLTMEPTKRLSSEAEAKTWLDSTVLVYASRTGITLLQGGSADGSGSGSGGAVINSEEFLKFQSGQERFVSQQIELYKRHLGRDPRAGEIAYENEKQKLEDLQARLDSIISEHGNVYIEGLQPVFDPRKARHFDSSWNWVRQDALLMFYDIIFGRLTAVDREITARCIQIMNRADPTMLRYMQYHIDKVDPERGPTYKLAKQLGQQLIDNCKDAVNNGPLYKDVTFPTAPHTEVTSRGDIVYTEVVRENVRKLEAYVEEMASGDSVPGSFNMQKVQDDVVKLWNVVKLQPEISDEQKAKIKSLYDGVMRSLCKTPDPKIPDTHRAPRSRRSSSQFIRPQVQNAPAVSSDKVPLLHLKRRVGTHWEYSSNLTGVYLDILSEIATSGTTFKDKNALLTGVGKGSIGIEILKGLLSGGAHVVITTSRYSRATVEYYQDIYQRFGSRGSALTVVPFNQGSRQDVEALIDYVYAELGLDLDYILPFAAVPENGREIDGIDDKSELAHRIMLVNLLRLLGAVKTKKASRHFVTRPTQVILPLSPNHGLFGNDGLYSESKISLETLFNRWSSESWGEYLCLAGAVIGWTRGTGLMSATNLVAQQVESYGVRTFSAKEMAFNILGLMHPLLFSITQVEPIWADLNGGMDRLPDLAEIVSNINRAIKEQAELCRAITLDNSADFKVVRGTEAERVLQNITVTPRANFKFEFPELESAESLADVSRLQGLLTLDSVIVVTGYGEVGPWGSSRTRWEMEARGEFTIEGCIEMAWLMGYIKHFDGRLPNGSLYVGWVDDKSGQPVDDKDVRAQYEKEILDHAGVRLIEPELLMGYDPNKKVFNQEIEITHDLEALEVDEEEALRFKHLHGDKCDVWAAEDSQWYVKLKKGARIFVPKAIKFSRTVAGQVPTGWHAGRYGIPQDIIDQVDRATLWALVCTADALNMSGITDPYELYKHMHPSEVGNCIGSGMGGGQSLRKMFRERRDCANVQSDILQETFINTTAGWINLLLMSSSGPIKIPVGACATALQSLEIACDTLLSGKAKVMLAGGFDDLSEEGSYEFAQMKATSDAHTEFAMGREPAEMSRPTTSTRSGFMESMGAGVMVVMTASMALKLGAPIRGVITFTSTSTDKAGRSVPAPGRGALGVAREIRSKHRPPILDITYRSRQLAFRRKQISEWLSNEHAQLREEVEFKKSQGELVDEEYISARVSQIEQDARHQEHQALSVYGMLSGTDPHISPLRRALAVYGLTADDINVLSIHGTSTVANEKNETHIWDDIFTQLDRTPGNAIPIMAQKSLCGHSKGGSAAWQFIGLIQTVNSGIIPGNRNADNVDVQFRKHEHLMFPSKMIQTDGIRAGIMSSFGFGQVGGIVLVLHPRYLLGALDRTQYDNYKDRNQERALACYKAMTSMMIDNSLVKIKDAPPYATESEASVLLNSMARATLDKKNNSYRFPKNLPSKANFNMSNVEAAAKVLATNGSIGIGVDHELISAVPSWNPTFVSRNFTDIEVEYCAAQPDPAASFAARWAGKEAVFKSLGVPSKGAAAAMKDIEILPGPSGAPTVTLHSDALVAAESRGIKNVLISLSHSDTAAIAFAQATS